LQALRATAVRIAIVFVALFILSLPFPWFVLPDVGSIVAPFFEMLARWSGSALFGITTPYTVEIVSDSIGMYIHLFDLMIISVVAGVVWYLADGSRRDSRLPGWLLGIGASWYLSLQLLRYGFEKLFKHQFYLPEPNTLFTPLGHLSPDILYWSAIGSSHSYSAFTGLVEIIPALLLLFERTRLLGALGAIGVMIHVLMINVGFDISVKILSAFLLLLAAIVAAPDAGALYRFFITKQPATTKRWRPAASSSRSMLFGALIKGFVVAIFLFESLYIYFASGSFNDDMAARPFMHGAYDVTLFVRGADTIPPLLEQTGRPRRIFFHRQGYFITQGMDDRLIDYSVEIDSAAGRLMLEGHGASAVLEYEHPDDSLLTLHGMFGGDSVRLETRQLDLTQLPLMRGGFHWTIDRYGE
jgi:hypothetical protein